MDGQELRKRHNDRALGYFLTPFLYYQTGRLQKQSVGWFLVSKHFSAGTLLHVPSGLNPSLKQLADSIWSVQQFSFVIFFARFRSHISQIQVIYYKVCDLGRSSGSPTRSRPPKYSGSHSKQVRGKHPKERIPLHQVILSYPLSYDVKYWTMHK